MLRTLLLVAAGAAMASGNVVSDPASFVNTLGGTDSRYDLSHGNVLPVVNRPWGFQGWAPITDTGDGSWWFHPSDARIYGVRATKQPSPWIGDYGQFRVMADMPDPNHNDNGQFSGYSPSHSAWKPFYWNASLLAYGNSQGELTTLEVTATDHGACIRVTFPSYVDGEDNSGWPQTRRIYVALNGGDTVDSVSPGNATAPPSVTGTVVANSGSAPSNFGQRLVMTLGGGPNGDQPLPVASSGQGDNNGPWAWFTFDPSATDAATRVVTIRVATSLISTDQAWTNLNDELPWGTGFDTVMQASHDAWNSVLSTVDVVDAGPAYTGQALTDVLTTLYSCLWRGATFPRFIHEKAANGSLIHWSPYDPNGNVYPGPLVSDSGFWDAYRTVYPAGQLLWPSVTAQMMQGWVNAYKEGGWLPKWASPGYRGSMVGTMGDVSLADAITKRAWLPGFDFTTAYAAIRQDAFSPPPAGEGEGRTCLPQYLANGAVVPNGAGCGEVVSRTLNYQLSDWSIAQAALSLGGSAAQDAPALLARAANYTRQFDGSAAVGGFMRSRQAANMSAFTEPFDQFGWGGDYTEAGPWQYRFYVPFDPQGLHSLYASSPAGTDMCDAIEAAQTMPSTFHIGAYGTEIHEQTEMASLCWGQYEHDNQPVHHMIWMLVEGDPSRSLSGPCASRGQYWLRQVTSRLYKPGSDMFVGDEDNGQLAHWFNLAALGLYSLAPGGPNITLGSPLFAHVRVRLDNTSGLVQQPYLDIIANNQGAASYYVTGASWNGAPVTGAVSLPYASLMQGGTLTFDLSTAPPSGYTGYNGHIKAKEQGKSWPWPVAHPAAKAAGETAAVAQAEAEVAAKRLRARRN